MKAIVSVQTIVEFLCDSMAWMFLVSFTCQQSLQLETSMLAILYDVQQTLNDRNRWVGIQMWTWPADASRAIMCFCMNQTKQASERFEHTYIVLILKFDFNLYWDIIM